jgi:hypothetical protein
MGMCVGVRQQFTKSDLAAHAHHRFAHGLSISSDAVIIQVPHFD